MKKILLFIFGILLLNSCLETSTKGVAKNKTKHFNECINVHGCTYVKTKIGNHDVYQYIFHTYMGQGSDIIHFDDMCDYCKQKNVK